MGTVVGFQGIPILMGAAASLKAETLDENNQTS